MEKSQHRHDISDKAWAILEPMLPGQRGQWGGIAEDNRWRGIATRYAKNSSSFLSAVHIRCIAIWLAVLT